MLSYNKIIYIHIYVYYSHTQLKNLLYLVLYYFELIIDIKILKNIKHDISNT